MREKRNRGRVLTDVRAAKDGGKKRQVRRPCQGRQAGTRGNHQDAVGEGRSCRPVRSRRDGHSSNYSATDQRAFDLVQWEGVENKSEVAIIAGASLVFIWFSSAVVSAVDSIPLVSKCVVECTQRM